MDVSFSVFFVYVKMCLRNLCRNPGPFLTSILDNGFFTHSESPINIGCVYGPYTIQTFINSCDSLGNNRRFEPPAWWIWWMLGVRSVVHGYVETASVICVLNHVEQTSDDIVGFPLYTTQLKVSFGFLSVHTNREVMGRVTCHQPSYNLILSSVSFA